MPSAAALPFLFIDIEATSLHPDSTPIEIAWVTEEGDAESYLIRPQPHWTDWSVAAQRLHGLTPALLSRDGMAAGDVAARFARAARGRQVVSDAVAFDTAWLGALCQSAGLDTPPVLPVQVAYARAFRPRLDAALPYAAQAERALEWVKETERREQMRRRVRHRALTDAQGLHWIWHELARA
ncbi:exonuclease domain-containing protein [Komagataeibacter rhaeticus]|uniref:3'-5' exonuclease n=1 Tax=Komagataeibacter rhaeticus TaxID=215221 RepID=UPI0039E9209F